MNYKTEGGPAFPTTEDADNWGMTLRDYFAAKAMHAVIRDASQFECDDIYARSAALAREAYVYADAMLAARGAA